MVPSVGHAPGTYLDSSCRQDIAQNVNYSFSLKALFAALLFLSTCYCCVTGATATHSPLHCGHLPTCCQHTCDGGWECHTRARGMHLASLAFRCSFSCLGSLDAWPGKEFLSQIAQRTFLGCFSYLVAMVGLIPVALSQRSMILGLLV